MNAQSPANTLESYCHLKNDWDGDGATAPQEIDIKNAFQFLKIILSLDIQEPIVGISSDGEINFVWNKKEFGIYIDVGFINGGFSYYAIDSDKKEKLKNADAYNQEDLLCLMEILRPRLEAHV
ncbi:Uncharacterised protein [Legionella donaldsonii]|uniref:Uncharacterized protein n=1 Tax=Legionella donaldsonii TaxID=45060 RepID=A0A378IZY4_9GAMM|nr:hypothetical protein [Legionella donaldsonii]STX40331.1 Uncharacterised protein [Legionella donaldsonii]